MMGTIARKSDGRRIFTDKFKREQIGRVWRGELTVAELSRKLGIARSLLQRWKRLMPPGVRATTVATGLGTAASELLNGHCIRELQLIGKQAVEIETLRAERDLLKSERRSRRASRP
jgi:transposase-like protein